LGNSKTPWGFPLFCPILFNDIHFIATDGPNDNFMKTIFDKSIQDGLITRIKSISDVDVAQWGTMNVHQMIAHCIKWDEMALGKTIYKQAFIGKLFGKFALPDFIGDDKPLKKHVPTVPEFKIKETSGDILSLKNQWIELIEDYNNFNNYHFIHPFFGKMTKEQIGIMAYKHSDHHLRQFGK
jgi:Protein of unknown function (DUF1569)